MTQSRGKKRRKRVVTVGLKGAYTLLHHINEAGLGHKIFSETSKTDQRIKISRKLYESIKQIATSEDDLAENHFVKGMIASGCDPDEDPECIPWE